MNREQAEKLLAAMIFDDLDEPSRTELLAYLQIDDELRDRLADMRMAAKLACDAVNDGPDPVLGEHRLKQLNRLAGTGGQRQIITLRRILAAAAVLTVGVVLVGLIIPSLSQVRHARTARLLSEGGVGYGTVLSRRPAPQEASRGPVGSEASRVGSDSIERYRGMGGMGGMGSGTTNGFRAGGMGGRGGYGGGMMGGMGATESTERPVARSDSFYYSTLRDQEVLNEQAPLDLRRGQPMSSKDVMDHKLEPLAQAVRESRTLDGYAAAGEGTYSKYDSSGSQQRPGSEPTTKADGDSVGQSLLFEEAQAATLGKPVATAPVTAPPNSARPSVEQPGLVLNGVNGPTAAGARVPVLGDKPLVGGLLHSESEVSEGTDSQALVEAREVDKRSSSMSAVPPDAVRIENRDRQEAAAALQTLEPKTVDQPSGSRFSVIPVNPWVMTDRDPLSTFALDVDTASYALCRRYIQNGFLPPVGAVRMEEFINAFDYAYPQRDGATFAVYAEAAPAPFAPAGQNLTLLKIAVKARTAGRDQRRPAHIVFVIDASASMGQADRLPQVQAALNLLVDKLFEDDRISLVTCADQARLHLEAVPAREKEKIRQTIDAIQPAGPTNLLAGLKVGYEMARRAFIAGRINQVVLCSDGVANVGRTEAEDVLEAVADDRRQGITLTCVGVGYGAYNDAFLEALADRGDGRYVFLDSSDRARDDLVGQLAATLQTVAKDARIQVHFNPHRVRRYRLIGYENRDIEDRRFRDDTVDAGEVGSGQCSTALYELELASSSAGEADNELATVHVRYRNAATGQIEEISRPLAASMIRRQSIEENPRLFLAAGAARFAEWLRQSEHARNTTPADIQDVLDRVSAALPLDRTVRDLAALVHQAENLPRASETTVRP